MKNRVVSLAAIASILTGIALISVMPARAALADFELPDTPFGRVAAAYFDAINSGDRERIYEFEVANRSEAALARTPADTRADRVLGLHGQVGKLVPGAVIETLPNKLVLAVHAEAMDMWLRVGFEFEETPPHKLSSIAMMPGSAPDAVAVDPGSWTSLAELLERIRDANGVPALAAAVVEGDDIVDAAVVGVRAAGTTDAAQKDDRFHYGSVTKSMTALAIAAVVERGDLDWDTRVGDVLADIEMRPEYESVTLGQLLHHRGGVPPYTHEGAEEEKRLAALAGTPTEQRTAFAARVLGEEPVVAAGEFEYSNAGYAVAALVAERATGASWEDLVRRHVFTAAGMDHAGFGWPATPERPDQPRGHFSEGTDGEDQLRPQVFDEYELGSWVAPAGDTHGSIEDLARYARYHLRGLRGLDQGVKSGTIDWLHTPPPAAGDGAYAGGWVVVNNPDLGAIHLHAGSGGTFYAQVMLYPDWTAPGESENTPRGRAIVVLMNTYKGAPSVVKQVLDAVLARDEEDP